MREGEGEGGEGEGKRRQKPGKVYGRPGPGVVAGEHVEVAGSQLWLG